MPYSLSSLFKRGAGIAASLVVLASPARADAVDTLHRFVQEVKAGKAAFSQTVTSPDGARTRKSSGSFEFQRPNRFRFDYLKPAEQTIVADGQKVWLWDPDLNQVTVRPFDQALGATPAALLAGGSIEKDFTVQADADADGLQWVQATPKVEGSIRRVRIGFRGEELAALEILDSFGQRSRLEFSKVDTSSAAVSPQRFRFTPPAGADVLK